MFAIVLLSIYLLAMILLGYWGMKKTFNLKDFFIAGREIGPWISAFAYGTTYFSAVLYIGFAGKLGWGFGLDVLWIAVGNTLFGALLAWLVLGKRTRGMTQNLDVMTMPEFFKERFQAKYIKIVAALIIFIFLLPYTASVFKGLGHLFEVNFNISYNVALLIMIAITGVYLIMGGYFAIVYTDFIQGIIMLIGSIAMVWVLSSKGGGLIASISTIMEKYPQHVPPGKQPGLLMLVSLVFMTSFGTWGLPQLVQKFYAIKNKSVITKAAIATTIFSLIIVFAAYFNGAMTHVFYDAVPVVNGAPAFDRLIPDLIKNYVPELLVGIILILILAASMSTFSSLVLVAASAISIDIYQGHINPNVSKEKSLLLIRALSGVFVIFSYIIAKYELAVIVTLMSLSWGAVSGAFMAPYIYGLYWKRTTQAGVWAGMATGLILAVSLFFILGPSNSPIASTIAMIAPFIVIPIVSIFTEPPQKELLEKAFKDIN